MSKKKGQELCGMSGSGCFKEQAASLCKAQELGRGVPDDTPLEGLDYLPG